MKNIAKQISKISFVISIIISSNALSNEGITKKNYFKPSFSNLILKEDFYIFQDNLVNLNIEYGRQLTKNMILGSYLGVGLYEEWFCQIDSISIRNTFINYKFSQHFGLSGHLLLSKFLFDYNINRFSLSLNGRVGFVNLPSSKTQYLVPITGNTFAMIPAKGTYIDLFIALEATFYFTQNFGIFINSGYKMFKYHNGISTYFGLTFRF